MDFFRKDNIHKDNLVPIVLELIVNNENKTVKAILNNEVANLKTELRNKYDQGDNVDIIQLSNR
ncbi:hypothetical protein C4F50_04745 [Flavobacterium sp. KB82]|uniref:Uncharacterized protein n=1 Tax=Flavobacterium hungaricum TaxID=2082725 RepID=A0ABR9TFW8_9FLAO|nr:hypothetical protein [Flavobacterium hungaricum]